MTSRVTTLVQLVCVLAVMAAVHSKSKVKPASFYFNICRRGDQKKMNDCIKETIMQAKSQLTGGIPDLGLVPIEPLVIPRMELNQGAGSFALNTTLTNFTIHGLSKYMVTDVNFVFDDKSMEANVTLFIPELIMTADYTMNGQVLVIPIRGKGNCEMNFTDVVTASTTKGRFVERKGKQYLELLTLNWDLSVNHEKSNTWFYNLFNGDKRLGDATNNFLNANGEEAFSAIKHLPEEAFGQVIKSLSSKVYDVYPIKELFLD